MFLAFSSSAYGYLYLTLSGYQKHLENFWWHHHSGYSRKKFFSHNLILSVLSCHLLFRFDKSMFSCLCLPPVEEVELLQSNSFIRNSLLTTEYRYNFWSSCWFAVYHHCWLKKKSFSECFHLFTESSCCNVLSLLTNR